MALPNVSGPGTSIPNDYFARCLFHDLGLAPELMGAENFYKQPPRYMSADKWSQRSRATKNSKLPSFLLLNGEHSTGQEAESTGAGRRAGALHRRRLPAGPFSPRRATRCWVVGRTEREDRTRWSITSPKSETVGHGVETVTTAHQGGRRSSRCSSRPWRITPTAAPPTLLVFHMGQQRAPSTPGRDDDPATSRLLRVRPASRAVPVLRGFCGPRGAMRRLAPRSAAHVKSCTPAPRGSMAPARPPGFRPFHATKGGFAASVQSRWARSFPGPQRASPRPHCHPIDGGHRKKRSAVFRAMVPTRPSRPARLLAPVPSFLNVEPIVRELTWHLHKTAAGKAPGTHEKIDQSGRKGERF